MRLLALVVLVTSLLAGCSGPKFQATNPAPRPLTARAPAEVETRTEMPAGDAYVEIGFWEVAAVSMAQVIEAKRAEAGERGCDLLVIADVGEYEAVANHRRYLARCLVAR